MKSILDCIESDQWRDLLTNSISRDVVSSLTEFLNGRIEGVTSIYPPKVKWFRALNEIHLNDVNVVILGQDPYHGEGQAQGLSFSVPETEKIPPSLRNIFKELKSDLDIENTSGDLSSWCKQGVLLLNAVLTVEKGSAGSHQNQGWEVITDQIIKMVSDYNESCVFLLWGSYAIKKSVLINSNKHRILTAPHPSPLSAYRGWFGSKHFSQTNDYLSEHNKPAIDWYIPSPTQLTFL